MNKQMFQDIDIDDYLFNSIVKEDTTEPKEFTPESLQEQLESLQKPKKPFPKDKKLFTTNKGNSYFILDNTKLLPKPKTLIGGGLKAKYKKQLDESMYNVTDKTIHELMEVLYLYKQIMDDMYPIVIRSNQYPKLTNTIAESLDEFFKTNSYLIQSIFETVDSSFFGVM